MPDHSETEMIIGYRTSPGVDATALSNRRALIDSFDALIAGDDAPFWALFDPDATFHEAACLPYGGAHQGLPAIQRAYAEMGATYSAMRSEFHEVLTAGAYCILYQTITFTVAANGNSGTLPVAELFRFLEGRIIEWRANYFDADLVARAIRGNRP